MFMLSICKLIPRQTKLHQAVEIQLSRRAEGKIQQEKCARSQKDGIWRKVGWWGLKAKREEVKRKKSRRKRGRELRERKPCLNEADKEGQRRGAILR